MRLPRVLRRAEEVLEEALRCEVLLGRGIWATFLLQGSQGPPLAVLKVVSPRRARLAAKVNDPNPFFANETPSERLVRERETLRSLAPHGLVPSLLDAGENYLLMAHVSGPSLAERRGASKEELIEVVTRIVEALGRIHELGFTHGDARPDNIILADKGPVFIDFEHLIDPKRPTGERRALDWLRLFNHIQHFRGDLFDGDVSILLKQIHQTVSADVLQEIPLLAKQLQLVVPPALLQSLVGLEA